MFNGSLMFNGQCNVMFNVMANVMLMVKIQWKLWPKKQLNKFKYLSFLSAHNKSLLINIKISN